ncbi:hypothetical protein [Mesorhizobium sp.]|uniref:hypothetical protein n=1 Tax=Mesorhizobium sp. TaxID=1871066 RepID=UPI0025F4EFBE|nr:hypothetical protein [Mesorhizobium sp.]
MKVGAVTGPTPGMPWRQHGSLRATIPDTVEALRAFAIVAAGHCTGWRGITALTNVFGDGKVVPLSVGKRFSF